MIKKRKILIGKEEIVKTLQPRQRILKKERKKRQEKREDNSDK